MPYVPRTRRAHAFTLIELLAVIAIIGILSALLYPAISKMQEKAKVTKKVSNLRQIWIAHALYVGDNDGRIVPAQDYSDRGNRVESNRMNWRSCIAKYLLAADTVDTSEANKMQIFIDPCFKSYDANSPTRTGFAMNVRPGLPDDKSENAYWAGSSSIAKDFRLIAITDASRRIFLADSATEWFFGTSGKPASTDGVLDMTRHENGKKGMALMYDGSTKLLTVGDAALASSDPQKLQL